MVLGLNIRFEKKYLFEPFGGSLNIKEVIFMHTERLSGSSVSLLPNTLYGIFIFKSVRFFPTVWCVFCFVSGRKEQVSEQNITKAPCFPLPLCCSQASSIDG